ncbi:MAG: ubiquitin-like small modifier protein 1 [Chloroflexota bacterium]|nr:ubiquitin-like small modifier protein 1 [Chloroflexota bacterium]
MTIEVRVTATLQRVVDGQRSVLGEGETVGELLEDLERKYPGFKGQLLTENGGIHRFVNIYLNDEDIRFLAKLETPLKDGDVLSILPAMAGGVRMTTMSSRGLSDRPEGLSLRLQLWVTPPS